MRIQQRLARWWSQRRGGRRRGAGACSVDPAAIGEAGRWWTQQVVGEAVGEATVVQAWRRSRSGCAGGREMIVARVRV
jgi:hypothetical protein